MILRSLRHAQNSAHVLFVQMEITRASISSSAVATRTARNCDAVLGCLNVKNLPDYVLAFGCSPRATIYAQVWNFWCHIQIVAINGSARTAKPKSLRQLPASRFSFCVTKCDKIGVRSVCKLLENMVEPVGIEPTNLSLRTMRSPRLTTIGGAFKRHSRKHERVSPAPAKCLGCGR